MLAVVLKRAIPEFGHHHRAMKMEDLSVEWVQTSSNE